MLPGARRGRLKIEQANHRADFAPHINYPAAGVERFFSPQFFRRRVCSWIMTVQWLCNTLLIGVSLCDIHLQIVLHFIYAGVFIRYYFVLLTSVEIYDLLVFERRGGISGGDYSRWSLNGSIFALRNERFFVVRLRGRLRAVFHCYAGGWGEERTMGDAVHDGERRCLNWRCKL